MTEWLRPDLVAVLVLVALVFSGIITPEQALTGFSSNAVIAILALLVVGTGMVRTGVVKWVADRLTGLVGDSRVRLMLVSTVAPGLLSGFINIVAAVSIFIPAVRRLAISTGFPASKLLMPMAVAGLMGANLTLIGASHNLVVNGLLREATGVGFGFFEFTPIGAIMLAFAVFYAVLVGDRLLPERTDSGGKDGEKSPDDLLDIYQFSDRLWEIQINADSNIGGRQVSDVNIGRHYGLSLITVSRGGEQRSIESSDFRLEAGDVVAVGGRREQVEAFVEAHEGLTLMGQPDIHDEFSWSAFELIELAVAPRSSAIGQTMRDMHFRRRTGLTCIALWRDDRPRRTHARDTALQEGDGVLLFGARENTREYEPDPDFLWLHRPRQEEAPRELRHLGPAAAVIFLALILAAAFNLTSIAIAALAGGAAMMLLGIMTPDKAYDSIQWSTIFLIAGMYPVGIALQNTGAAAQIAGLITATVGGFDPVYALVIVVLLSLLLTQPMHNAVVAVIMTPVALQVADSLGSNPKAFAVAVILGASASFLMPIGHPAPLMVRDPGGYKTADYLKFGLVLVPLILAVATFVIPLIWPL